VVAFVLQIAGAVLLTGAALIVAIPLGLAVAGVALVVFGLALERE
jgi:hypothetical protein